MIYPAAGFFLFPCPIAPQIDELRSQLIALDPDPETDLLE
jgi:hypothetical protein